MRKRRSWLLVPSLHGKDGETVETVSDFIFLGSKITADGDCMLPLGIFTLEIQSSSYEKPKLPEEMPHKGGTLADSPS